VYDENSQFACPAHEKMVSEQVPCRWSSDSEGATAVRIELKPMAETVQQHVDGGWRNDDAVVQQLERPVQYTAQTDNPCKHLYTVTPSLYVTRSATSSKCSSE